MVLEFHGLVPLPDAHRMHTVFPGSVRVAEETCRFHPLFGRSALPADDLLRGVASVLHAGNRAMPHPRPVHDDIWFFVPQRLSLRNRIFPDGLKCRSCRRRWSCLAPVLRMSLIHFVESGDVLDVVADAGQGESVDFGLLAAAAETVHQTARRRRRAAARCSWQVLRPITPRGARADYDEAGVPGPLQRSDQRCAREPVLARPTRTGRSQSSTSLRLPS